jgi:hypothetical protein
MTFSTSYLTNREINIWNLRRNKHSQTEIGKLLGMTRQAAYRALGIIDTKVERSFTEVAVTNNLVVKHIYIEDGLMEAYSPVHNIPVFVTLSKSNGLKVWYVHEGNCSECVRVKSCRDFVESEVKERGLNLSEEERALPPTKLVLKVFDKIQEDRVYD